MSIRVRYFASLREQMGCAGQHLQGTDCLTARDVWQAASGGRELPCNVLVAVNLEYVPLDHPVSDGDEVAFFPPVTGG